jgi:WD40 repeat protein
VDSGKKMRDFHSQGRLSPVVSLAVSGDGKSLVSGMADGMAHLWMPADGKKVLTVQAVNNRVGDPEVNKVCSVALTDDGKRFATVSDRGRHLKLWHTADGTKTRDQRVGRVFEREPIVCVRLFDDGKRIKVGAAKGLWEIDNDAGSHRFVGQQRPVTSMALSRDEKHLVTGSQDKTAILWDVSHTRQIRTFDGHAGAVTGVALSDDGKFVLTGTENNLAILWDAATGQKAQTFAGHTGAVTGLALSGDGKHLWTASLDGTTRLWDRAKGKERCCLYSLNEGKDWHVVTPDGRFVYASNAGTDSIAGYRIAANGALTPIGATIVGTNPGGSTNLDITISADGRFLYSLNAGSGTVGMFAIGRDGALTNLGVRGGLEGGAGLNGIAAN